MLTLHDINLRLIEAHKDIVGEVNDADCGCMLCDLIDEIMIEEIKEYSEAALEKR